MLYYVTINMECAKTHSIQNSMLSLPYKMIGKASDNLMFIPVKFNDKKMTMV